MAEKAGRVLAYATPAGREARQSRWGTASLWCAGLGLLLASFGCGALAGIHGELWLLSNIFTLLLFLPAGMIMLMGVVCGIVGMLQGRARRGAAIAGVILNFVSIVVLQVILVVPL